MNPPDAPAPLPRGVEAPSAVRSSWARRSLLIVAIVGSLVALLAAGALMLVALNVTPNPGRDLEVLILKAVLLAGWIGTLVWLARRGLRGSLALVLAPIAAWVWVFLLAAMLGNLGFLNYGY